MADRGSNLRLFADAEFLSLTGTAFARSQAYSTILIALALYADLFGTTGVIEGLFGTGFALVQFLIVLPLGRAIDTGDAKRYLLVGLALNVAVFVGFALVDSAIHVVLVRMLQGIGASILWLTGSTVIGEISPEDARGRWFGTYNQVGAFSSLSGDLIGGYLLYAHGFGLTYAVLSGITLLAFVLVLLFLRSNPGGLADPEAAAGLETFRRLLAGPTLQSLVAFRGVFSMGKMIVIIFLPIYARTTFGISAIAIGGILAGGKLTKTVLQGWMGDLADRLGGQYRFVAAGALLYAVGTAAIPAAGFIAGSGGLTLAVLGRSVTLSAPFLALFAAYGIVGIGDSIRLPASMALFTEAGERHDAVASSLSLRSVVWKVGMIAGPTVAGFLKDYVSSRAAFWAGAGFVLASTALFLGLYTRRAAGTDAAVAAD